MVLKMEQSNKKSIDELFPVLLSVVTLYPAAEKCLVSPVGDYPSESDVNYLYGFIAGLNAADKLTGDYYISCIAELQRYEEGDGVSEADCFTPDLNNPYPLCVGKDLPLCKDCQSRADWSGEHYRDE